MPSARLAVTVAVATLVAGRAGKAAAQQLAATEITAGALTAISGRDFWGAAAGLGRRLDSQTRFAGLAAVGMLGGAAALRLELTAQLIVNPSGRGGAGLYAGTGVAWQGGRGTSGHGYVTALVGVERAPGSRRGWFAELGLGGGVRLCLGLRWRRFASWGR